MLASFCTAWTCIPPLWAKALPPTYGWPGLGTTLAISYTNRLTSVSMASVPGRRQSWPSFSCRLAASVSRSMFPHRSPTPLTVPWACVAPAPMAAWALARASPPSLCVWMPTRAEHRPRTAAVASAICSGRPPPFVSHNTSVSAPAASAAASVPRA